MIMLQQSEYKCLVLQKELTKNGPGGNQKYKSLMITKPIDNNCLRLRELGKLSKLYLLVVINSVRLILYENCFNSF